MNRSENMLERLELNNRDPRSKELYVRHRQVYSLLELNVCLCRIKNGKISIEGIDKAISEVSRLTTELVARFEDATDPSRTAPDYTEAQILKLENASTVLKSLCDCDAPVADLLEAARSVVIAGAKSQFPRPRLVVSNAR